MTADKYRDAIRPRLKATAATPVGASRGRVDHHAELVERCKAEVLPLRAGAADAAPQNAV